MLTPLLHLAVYLELFIHATIDVSLPTDYAIAKPVSISNIRRSRVNYTRRVHTKLQQRDKNRYVLVIIKLQHKQNRLQLTLYNLLNLLKKFLFTLCQ